MPIQSGAFINQRVRLVRWLGRGAFGEVWLGHHTGLGAEVAVKLILESARVSRRDALMRFRREAEVAARIHSPYVVRTYDHGFMHDGTPYIVMERLVGCTLDQRIAARGPFTLDEAIAIARQVGAVLDEAHAAGVVHRDVKPQNIFLLDGVEQTFVKVLDWGSAKRPTCVGDEHTNPRLVLGSPAYFSREVLTDPGRVDARTDLWALSMTLYKCLTGTLPYRGRELGDVCDGILEGDLVPPRAHRPELPAAIDSWFAAAFHHDPGRRPATGLELGRSLERAARSSARGRARRRRQLLLSLAAGMPVTALVLAVLLVAMAPRADASMTTPRLAGATGSAAVAVMLRTSRLAMSLQRAASDATTAEQPEQRGDAPAASAREPVQRVLSVTPSDAGSPSADRGAPTCRRSGWCCGASCR